MSTPSNYKFFSRLTDHLETSAKVLGGGIGVGLGLRLASYLVALVTGCCLFFGCMGLGLFVFFIFCLLKAFS
jgi:hypothetical protein